MKNSRLEVKQNRKKEWHWRLIASNGKIVCIGGETFKNKPKSKALLKIADSIGDALANDRIEYYSQRGKKN